MKLIIVRGLPGSGKTTFAKAFEKRLAATGENTTVIAADDHFTSEDGYNFNPAELGKAHSSCRARTLQALREGHHVIVHNTFTKVNEFDPYLSIAAQTSSDVEVYNVFDGGLTDEQLFERGTHGVPLDTIKKMRARYCHAPLSETHVHSEGGYAYWQYPASGWLDLETQPEGKMR